MAHTRDIRRCSRGNAFKTSVGIGSRVQDFDGAVIPVSVAASAMQDSNSWISDGAGGRNVWTGIPLVLRTDATFSLKLSRS